VSEQPTTRRFGTPALPRRQIRYYFQWCGTIGTLRATPERGHRETRIGFSRGTGLALLHDLPRLMESASMEDRKEFVRAFVGGVSVVPGEARLDVQMRTLPALGALQHANSTCGLVAGARYEPLQIEMSPLNLYLAGLRRVA